MVSEPVAYPSRRAIRAQAARASARHARHPERAVRVTGGQARHATDAGQGFTWLTVLTALGALLPGAGLIAAGRRRSGAVVLGLFLLAVGALGAVVAAGGVTELGLQVATRPDALLVAAVVAVGVAALWSLVVVVGHLLLRRTRLTVLQRVLSGLLVTALVGLVAAPGVTAARYALTQRSLILTVFDEEDGDGREGGLASPDVGAQDPWADEPRVNVLLLGSDAGPGRVGTRTDTMIVASIDTDSGETVLFSVPRNLEGPVFAEGSVGAELFPDGFHPSGPGTCVQNDCHLNAVWSWAQDNPQHFPGVANPGLRATRDAISGVLGIPLDYYAIVNLQGFEDVIDAIGGIRMTVDRRIPIGGGTNLVTGDRYPITGYIEPGEQVLDGYHALWYARSREGSDDYDRMARQQCVVAAVAEQADPVRLARAFPRLASSAERNVFTDVRGSELEAFVELALRVQDAHIRSVSFDRDVITPEDPDFEAIHEIVADALEPRPEPTTGPTPAESPTPSGPDDDGPDDDGPAAGDPTPTPTVTSDPAEPVDVEDVCG